MEKISVTISLYFEITGAEIFGGDVGYSESKIDLNTESLAGFNLKEYAKDQKEGITEIASVPIENVKIIRRKEYEENTEED